MLRLLAVLLLALAVGIVRAADALILIRHDRAGPNLRMGAYTHPDWLLWPAEVPAGSQNGLLSILSGLDWEGDRADLQFESRGPLTWRSLSFDSLSRSGYLAARSKNLGYCPVRLIADRANGAESEAILLATGLSGPMVHAHPFKAPLPHDGLVVFGALSWDDVESISARAGGRTLVIELPAQPGEQWTRFWEYRNGRPDLSLVPEDRQLKVPGLIRLDESLDLLRHPDRFDWPPDASKRWGGPNRWLDHATRISPMVILGLYTVSACLAFLALVTAMNEQSSPLIRVLLRAAMLAPATDVLSGNLARFAGLDAWPILFACCEFALLGLSAAMAAWIGSRVATAHALFATFLVGAAAMCIGDPIWSDFSSVLRLEPHTEATGIWLGYLTGAFAFAGSLGRPMIWIRRVAALVLLVLSCLSEPWWMRDGIDTIALTVVPFAAAEGACCGLFLGAVALLPTALVHLGDGLSWRPGGLLRSLSQQGTVNGVDWVASVASPGFLATGFLVGAGLLFGNRFLAYRVKHLVHEDSNRMSLAYAAVATAAYSLLHPAFLSAAVVLLIGAILTVLHEAVA